MQPFGTTRNYLEFEAMMIVSRFLFQDCAKGMSRPRQTAQNYAIAVKNASVPPVQNEIDVKAYVEQHQFSHTWYKGTSDD